MQAIDITGRCRRACASAPVWLVLALALAFGLAGVPGFSYAQDERQQGNPDIFQSEAFLAGHPDVRWRLQGLREQERGNDARAFRYFQRAARHADKPSQAMVAEMIWKGEGAPRDPALAYAWMDLAAERGYPGFTILRERYWAQLDEAQRRDAVARGEDIYAEFGDEVAKPRIATVLRRESRRVTGSRLGFVGFLTVQIPGPGGQIQSIDGNRFYDKKFWDPELYQAWHDAVWMEPNEGRVRIGDVEPLRRDAPDEDD